MAKFIKKIACSILLVVMQARTADLPRIQVVHGVAQLADGPCYRIGDHVIMFERLVQSVIGQDPSLELYNDLKQNPSTWIALLGQKSGRNVADDEILIPIQVRGEKFIRRLPYSWFDKSKEGEAVSFRASDGACLIRLVVTQGNTPFQEALAARIAKFLKVEELHKEGLRWLAADEEADWKIKIEKFRHKLGEEAAKDYEEELRALGKIS